MRGLHVRGRRLPAWWPRRDERGAVLGALAIAASLTILSAIALSGSSTTVSLGKSVPRPPTVFVPVPAPGGTEPAAPSTPAQAAPSTPDGTDRGPATPRTTRPADNNEPSAAPAPGAAPPAPPAEPPSPTPQPGLVGGLLGTVGRVLRGVLQP